MWSSPHYYYYKNIFGDILGIMDVNGDMVVRYAYDAWGNPISVTGAKASTLGKDNPFRYRGYYYDVETGLYYLNARYYNPESGRFISPDQVLDTTGAIGCNMYAYCGNDPVNFFDPSGAYKAGLTALQKRQVDERAAYINKIQGGMDHIYNTTVLSEELKHFIATVAGEAEAGTLEEQQVVAQSAMNRLREPRDVWSSATNLMEILIPGQYNGVGTPRYALMMEYLNNRTYTHAVYEQIISATVEIYYGYSSFSDNAHYVFNAKKSVSFEADLKKNPRRYQKLDPIPNVSDIDYRRYRCLY